LPPTVTLPLLKELNNLNDITVDTEGVIITCAIPPDAASDALSPGLYVLDALPI
jgi:hypothetical protein